MVQSASALLTLQVGPSDWDKDIVLQIVCHLASPLQLKVTKKGKGLSLEVQGHTLSSRNAILRAICGAGLHFALDQAPFYLLGGHSSASKMQQSRSAVAMGALHYWMSLAASKSVDEAFLENHLKEHAFLIGTPSIADWDVAMIFLSTQHHPDGPHTQRWLETVTAQMAQRAQQTQVKWSFEVKMAQKIPVFFDGTEDISLIQPVPAKTQAKAKPQQQKKGKEQPKQEKKKEKQAKQAPAPATFDISALDIRVGKIVKAWHHEKAEKLFCEEIDLGEGQVRQIASGLRPFYQTSDLENRYVLVLCNLKKRNLVGFPSHGMVLCASNADHTSVEFVVPPEGATIGERVAFEGIEMKDPEAENKVAKKKIFEGLAPDLKTNDEGVVVWKGATATTTKGPVKALNGMAGAQVS